jgi:tRNA(His) guanylyltransferase
MKHDEIMVRMKSFYEGRSRTYLTRRTPVIIRLDGKAFHTYTRGLDKPFDEGLIEDMQQTAIYLCQNIQGAKCAYTQSDEISILVTDYDTLTTDAWFDYNVQKMVSVSASLATGKFNQLRAYRYYDESIETATSSIGVVHLTLANFDSRAFNIPKEEVVNYFYARQRDAVKNSISMLAQSLYSHKELHKKNGNQMQEMCFQKGHNWNDLHFSKKRGSFVIKNTYYDGQLPENYYLEQKHEKSEEAPIIRTKWEVVETPEKFTENNFKEYLWES